LNANPKQAQPRCKRAEKDLTPAAGKEYKELFHGNALLQQRKYGVLFQEPMHIYVGKHFRGGHFPEQAQCQC
jgi:hypothetical protein